MQRPSVLQSAPTTVEDLVQRDEKANDKATWIVFRKMLFFTVMMTLAPIGSFFISKAYFFDILFNAADHNTSIYSTIVAVVVVHVILVAFVYVAFRDDRGEKKTASQILKESAGKKD